MGFMTETCCLPIEVFKGGGGDIVLLQEFPSEKGEQYLRVFVSVEDADRVCAEIMRIAGAAKR
jgi:hypothetical protein